jgi:hypothetical protein
MSTPAKRASNAKYLATQKTTVIRTPPEEAETFKSAAETAGQSLQGYILQAVRERMERESANKYYIGIPKTAADQAGERNKQTGKEWLIETVKKALEE